MRHAHRAGLRTTATMMYGTVETDEERLEHMLRLRDAAGRDRRLHGVHHLELSARAHRARRHRGHRHRVPAHAGDRAARARQLRQPAGVVGDAGRQGRAAEPGLRRQRHGQRDDRGERRARRRRQPTAWTKSRSSATSRTPGSSPSAATCTTRFSAIRSSASATCRACSSSPTARADGDTSVPAELVNYPARSAAAQAAAHASRRHRWHDPPRRRVGPADRSAVPFATAGSPSTTAASSAVGQGHAAEAMALGPVRDLGQRGAAARPRQRAHASRAVVAARPRAAGGRLHRLGHAS